MCSSNSTDTWAVLVAGEHHTVSKSLGGHASITSIGDAFDILRLRLPRDRIIVIAQLEECRIWHDLDFEHKVKDVKDFDSAERQRPMWEEKKESFQKHLGGLMSDGGADYDGAMVNPDTVLRVILGEKSDKYPKVIEYQEGKTKVFFSLFGHGSWNGKDENHYFYFPYPSDPILRSLSQTARRNPPPTATNEADNLAGDFVFNDGSINAAGQIDASPTNDSDQTPHPIVSTLLDIDVTSQRPIIEYEPALSDRSVSAVSAVTASLLTQTQTPSQSPESLSDGAMPSDPTASRVQPDGPPIAIAESDPDNPDGCDSESPVECVGLHDPLYQSINSYLPLKGGPHTPFRVQIRYQFTLNTDFVFATHVVFCSYILTTSSLTVLAFYLLPQSHSQARKAS